MASRFIKVIFLLFIFAISIESLAKAESDQQLLKSKPGCF